MSDLTIDQTIEHLLSIKASGASGTDHIFIPAPDTEGRDAYIQRVETVGLVSVAKADMDKGFSLCKIVSSRGVPVVAFGCRGDSKQPVTIDAAIELLSAAKTAGALGTDYVFIPSRDNNGRAGFLQRVEMVGRIPVAKAEMERGYGLCRIVSSRGTPVVLLR